MQTRLASRFALSLAASSVLGCAAAPKPVTPRYPALSEGAHEASVTFTPAEGALPITLPCTQAENEIDNGLDDDCNGTVDHHPLTPAAPVLVTLSHSTQTDVALALTKGATDAASTGVLGRTHVCDAGASFAVQTLRVSKLEQGRYELTLARGATCGAELSGPVDAAIWIHGKPHGVYAVNVAPGAATRLGTVDVQ